MSEYFELKPDEGFQFLLGEGDGFMLFSLFREHRGRQIGENWVPLTVEVISKNRGRALKAGDFIISFWAGLFFRESARRVLHETLQKEGEVLSFSSNSGESLFFFNPLICDCLIATGEHLANDAPKGTPGKWQTWADFDEAKSSGRQAFVVPELWPRTFVSRSLVDLIKTSGLTGARFDSMARTAT